LYIDYSDAGRLLGHIVLGSEILESRIRSLKKFPEEEALLLKHLILSHHGEAEFGAVKLPMTREAVVLHFADDLDAKLNTINRIISNAGDGDLSWTSYQPLFERFFFRGFPASPESCFAALAEEEREKGRQLSLWAKGKREPDG
jgi:3'-5' exoribonuclease